MLKYLGVLVSDKGRFDDHIKARRGAGIAVASRIARLGSHGKSPLAPAVQGRFARAVLNPSLDFASAVVPHPGAARMGWYESVQHRAACSILGVSWSTASAMVRQELGMLSVAARHDSARLRFFIRLLHDPSSLAYHMLAARRAVFLSVGRSGVAPGSFCAAMDVVLRRYNLAAWWSYVDDDAPPDAAVLREMRAVARRAPAEAARKSDMDWVGEASHSSATTYRSVRRPGTTYAAYLGDPQLRPSERRVRSLQTQLRLESGVVGLPKDRRDHVPAADRVCAVCGAHTAETPVHFLFECQAQELVANRDNHWNVRIPAAFAAVGPEGSRAWAERLQPQSASAATERLRLALGEWPPPRWSDSAAVTAGGRAAGRQFVGDMVTVRTLLVA